MKKTFKHKTKDGLEYKVSLTIKNNQWSNEKAGVYDEYEFKVSNEKEFTIKIYFSEVLETQWAVDLTVDQIRKKKVDESVAKVKKLLDQGVEEDQAEYFE